MTNVIPVRICAKLHLGWLDLRFVNTVTTVKLDYQLVGTKVWLRETDNINFTPKYILGITTVDIFC